MGWVKFYTIGSYQGENKKEKANLDYKNKKT